MMKTIMVVSQVSFQLGQVTFLVSRRTCWKNCDRRDAAARRAALPRPPVLRPSFSSRRPFHTLLILQTWQERRDSNPRPSVLETDALPAELHSYAGLGLSASRPRPADSITLRTARLSQTLPLQSYLMIFATTPAPTVRPPSRMAKRSFSSIAIGTISSTSHRDIVARHHHLRARRQLDDAGHVGGAEIELRTVVGEERRMTAALFLGQDIGFRHELGVRRHRTRLGQNLAALDAFTLNAAQQRADIVARLALVQQLAEHLNAR